MSHVIAPWKHGVPDDAVIEDALNSQEECPYQHPLPTWQPILVGVRGQGSKHEVSQGHHNQDSDREYRRPGGAMVHVEQGGFQP